MTPGARVAAAIEILDEMASGTPAEKALTRWARNSRFAGSKDRAAIRDHVFDVLRSQRSAVHFGQGTTGRAQMIGMLHTQGVELGPLFDGAGHAPSPLTEQEQDWPATPLDKAVLWNLPDWIMDAFAASLGADAERTALTLQNRAPVTLRVNLARITVADAMVRLSDEGVEVIDNPLAEAALTITDGARKLRNSRAYMDGLVELQDAASQAVVACLPTGGRVLDYCAGGGGKALAFGMDPTRNVYAHDIAAQRMNDLPVRADRAGAQISVLAPDQVNAQAPFDVVLCDAPCSGSGAWRRAPEGKWTLTPDRLKALTQMQDDILDRASELVAPEGLLAFATCSVLNCENADRINAFLARHSGWRQVMSQTFDVSSDGDGFFTAHLTRV